MNSIELELAAVRTKIAIWQKAYDNAILNNHKINAESHLQHIQELKAEETRLLGILSGVAPTVTEDENGNVTVVHIIPDAPNTFIAEETDSIITQLIGVNANVSEPTTKAFIIGFWAIAGIIGIKFLLGGK